jgi:excisionase family DNA binding protein
MLPGIVAWGGLIVAGMLPSNLLEYLQTVNSLWQLAQLLIIGALVIGFVISRLNSSAAISNFESEQIPDILTIFEAARYLNVSELNVLDLIETGRLKAEGISGEYRISRDALKAYLNA